MIQYKNKTFSFKKISEKFKYLVGIYIFLATNKAIWVFFASCIGIKLKLKNVIYTIKTLIFLFNAILVNLFLSMIFIQLVVNKALTII